MQGEKEVKQNMTSHASILFVLSEPTHVETALVDIIQRLETWRPVLICPWNAEGQPLCIQIKNLSCSSFRFDSFSL